MSDLQNRRPRRTLLFGVAYLACCVALVLVTPWCLHQVDAAYPTLFYPLAPGEEPGPMGDPAVTKVAVAFDYLGLLLLVVPVAYACRVRWGYVLALALLHEMIILGVMTALVSVGAI